MKRMPVVLAIVLALAVAAITPASGREWIDKSLVAAAEKALSTMPADFYAMDPAAAQQAMEAAKPLVLDVRETAELAKGKVPGAVNIPIRDLPKMIAKLPESKTAPIITYCQVGYRGGMAVMALRMWGYTNVRTIRGGLDNWMKANLPVEKAA